MNFTLDSSRGEQLDRFYFFLLIFLYDFMSGLRFPISNLYYFNVFFSFIFVFQLRNMPNYWMSSCLLLKKTMEKKFLFRWTFTAPCYILVSFTLKFIKYWTKRFSQNLSYDIVILNLE